MLDQSVRSFRGDLSTSTGMRVCTLKSSCPFCSPPSLLPPRRVGLQAAHYVFYRYPLSPFFPYVFRICSFFSRLPRHSIPLLAQGILLLTCSFCHTRRLLAMDRCMHSASTLLRLLYCLHRVRIFSAFFHPIFLLKHCYTNATSNLQLLYPAIVERCPGK